MGLLFTKSYFFSDLIVKLLGKVFVKKVNQKEGILESSFQLNCLELLLSVGIDLSNDRILNNSISL